MRFLNALLALFVLSLCIIQDTGAVSQFAPPSLLKRMSSPVSARSSSSAPSASSGGLSTGAASHSPTFNKLTNGQRLAQGLPLKAPERRQTRIAGAKRAGASPIPNIDIDGYIALYTEANVFYSYLGTSVNNYGSYKSYTASTPSTQLRVRANLGSLSQGVGYITVLNSQVAYSYLGLVMSPYGPSGVLKSGSAAYTFLAGTDSTPVGSIPTFGGNTVKQKTGSNMGMESAVWSYDPSTLGFSLKWVNSNSASIAVNFGYHIASASFIATGDRSAFTTSFGVTTWLKMVFVPASV